MVNIVIKVYITIYVVLNLFICAYGNNYMDGFFHEYAMELAFDICDISFVNAPEFL